MNNIIKDINYIGNQIDFLCQTEEYNNFVEEEKQYINEGIHNCFFKIMNMLVRYGKQYCNQDIFKYLNDIKNRHDNSLFFNDRLGDIYWTLYKYSNNRMYYFLLCELQYQTIDELYKKREYDGEIIEKYKKYLNEIFDIIKDLPLNMNIIVDIFNLKNICSRDNNIYRYYITFFGGIWININNLSTYIISNYIHINNENDKKIKELEKENNELKTIFNNISSSYNKYITKK